MHKKERGFTLMELIAVIIIIGVLATLAVSTFSIPRERALGKEAQVNLKLIKAAQKIYNMEHGYYYPYSESGSESQDVIATINTYLKLSLTATNWGYSVTGSQSTFSGQAGRNGLGRFDNCVYTINNIDPDPIPNSTTDCPQ